MKKLIFAFLLPILAAVASPARALDVPPGGDALFHQVRSSKVVAVGVLSTVTRDKLSFKAVQSIDGTVPATLDIPTDPYVTTLRLTPGKSYTLFLVPQAGDRGQTESGKFQFAVSMYSLVLTEPRDVGSFREAVALFRKAQSDRSTARTPLLQMLRESKVPYLQYSAAQGLRKMKLLKSEDLPNIQSLLQPSLDPRAQEMLVRETSRIGGVEHKILEDLIRNPQTTVTVKAIAVEELFRAKGANGLKPLLKDIDTIRSPRLKKQIGGLLTKQPLPPVPEDQ